MTLAEDGSTCQIMYCPNTADMCFGNSISMAISRCEERSSKKCRLFSYGEKIVWDGPVTFQ